MKIQKNTSSVKGKEISRRRIEHEEGKVKTSKKRDEHEEEKKIAKKKEDEKKKKLVQVSGVVADECKINIRCNFAAHIIKNLKMIKERGTATQHPNKIVNKIGNKYITKIIKKSFVHRKMTEKRRTSTPRQAEVDSEEEDHSFRGFERIEESYREVE